MDSVDRVALVAVCWFALWIAVGIGVGVLVNEPGTGAVSRFFFALIATLAWPWLMPDSINDWMDDLPA